MTHPNLQCDAGNTYTDVAGYELRLQSMRQEHGARTEVRDIQLNSFDYADTLGTSTKMDITHLLFEGWPDLSIPESNEDQQALLRLSRMTRGLNTSSTLPRVIHCSGGVGRTGTFIALDFLLMELEEGSLDQVKDDDDPVMSCVRRLRNQRSGMVLSKTQFYFLYDCLRDSWLERWSNLGAKERMRLETEQSERIPSDPSSHGNGKNYTQWQWSEPHGRHYCYLLDHDGSILQTFWSGPQDGNEGSANWKSEIVS